MTKEYLGGQFYPWVQASCPWYTDHGEKHVEAVIEAAGSLLAPAFQAERADRLDCMALYCLLMGILWHDVGMVSGRSGHAKKVAEMTDQVKRIAFPNPSVQGHVARIAAAHSGEDGLQSVDLEADFTGTHRTHTIFPRALAALLRFADELSDDQRRVSQSLLDMNSVPDRARIYWEYARCVAAVRPDPARGRVIVTIEVQRDTAHRQFPCTDYPTRTVRGHVSLIEYIVCRLEKMNNERCYCSPHFLRYTSPIDEIEVRFSMYSGGERVPEYDFTEVIANEPPYRHSALFDGFFLRHPLWSASSLQEAHP